MKHDLIITAYLVLMGGLIVTVDVLFLRDHFWPRLGTNVGIVVIFALFYLLVLRNSLK